MKTEELIFIASTDHQKTPGAKLRMFRDAAEFVCNETSDALIASGYGLETMAETRARAKSTGDALACRNVAAWEARHSVVEELRRRERWHGSHNIPKSDMQRR